MSVRRSALVALGLAVSAVLAVEATPRPSAPPAQAKLSPRQIQRLPGWKTYKQLCADCHGEKGDGKGPLGKTMTPEPANYQDCEVLGALSDEDVRRVILEGSAALGRSNAMQGFKKKIKDPAVVDELIEVIRSFGGCAPKAGS